MNGITISNIAEACAALGRASVPAEKRMFRASRRQLIDLGAEDADIEEGLAIGRITQIDNDLYEVTE